jgi:hypothetical protein
MCVCVCVCLCLCVCVCVCVCVRVQNEDAEDSDDDGEEEGGEEEVFSNDYEAAEGDPGLMCVFLMVWVCGCVWVCRFGPCATHISQSTAQSFCIAQP